MMHTPDIFEIQLDFRKEPGSKRPIIESPKSAYEVLYSNWDQIYSIPSLKVLFLDQLSGLVFLLNITGANISNALETPEVIFKLPRAQNAAFMVVAHNCPSGMLEQKIIKLTSALLAAAKDHDIEVRDHLLVTQNGYYSMFQMGLLSSNQSLKTLDGQLKDIINSDEKFEFFQNKAGQWFWVRKDLNGNERGRSRNVFDNLELCEFNAKMYGYKKENEPGNQV